MTKIEAGKTYFVKLNEQVREILKKEDSVELDEVFGQRYIGCTLQKDKRIVINGTPGNDMCAYMCGGEVEVFGSCQEATGNTMDGGKIIIHGNSGDALGYAMRDGEIFVERDVACRVGIHMKEFNEKKPVIVIGGKAGDFLGEYMAGGKIILLGLGGDDERELSGKHCLTGMHGGKMLVRGELSERCLSNKVKEAELDEEDKKDIENYVNKYCEYFGADKNKIMSEKFRKYIPISSRPYGNMYTHN